MAWYDRITKSIGDQIMAAMMGMDKSDIRRDYYTGRHPRQLKVKDGAFDDNLVLNYVGLATSRSISRLFRGGVKFALPEGADAQQEYLDAVWDANKQEQLLYQLALNGAVYGTPYVKIIPEGAINRVTGETLPRLIALDPEITRIEVNPFDVDDVERYVIEFTVGDKSYKEVTRKTNESDYEQKPDAVANTWIVEHFILDRGGKWIPDPAQPPVEWPFDFPPILHWKNLPSLKAEHGAYGCTDAEWAIGAQDKLNFADSNINKTIRLMAAPPTIATGVNQRPELSTGPGSFTWLSSPDAKVYNLQANADITGSRAFASDLQNAIFGLMREVPPSVINSIGSGLTNFVMRVIYADALDQTDTKREHYGDALMELNRRLLVLNGEEGDGSNPGEVQWGDPLPENSVEKIAEDTFLLTNGLASKATIAAKYGIDYETEKAAIDAESADSTGNVGAFLLKNFNQGA